MLTLWRRVHSKLLKCFWISSGNIVTVLGYVVYRHFPGGASKIRTIKSRSTAYAFYYIHTDKHGRLVMKVVVLCSTRQSQAPNIDRCAPKNSTLTHDLDPWPLTLTFKATCVVETRFLAFDLDPDAKNQGQMVQLGERTQSDRWTDGHYQVHYLPPSWSIIIPLTQSSVLSNTIQCFLILLTGTPVYQWFGAFG